MQWPAFCSGHVHAIVCVWPIVVPLKPGVGQVQPEQLVPLQPAVWFQVEPVHVHWQLHEAQGLGVVVVPPAQAAFASHAACVAYAAPQLMLQGVCWQTPLVAVPHDSPGLRQHHHGPVVVVQLMFWQAQSEVAVSPATIPTNGLGGQATQNVPAAQPPP